MHWFEDACDDDFCWFKEWLIKMVYLDLRLNCCLFVSNVVFALVDKNSRAAVKWCCTTKSSSRGNIHFQRLFSTKIRAARSAAPRLNEPPTCLFLSSYLCTACSALGPETPHKQPNRISWWEKNTKLSAHSLCPGKYRGAEKHTGPFIGFIDNKDLKRQPFPLNHHSEAQLWVD